MAAAAGGSSVLRAAQKFWQLPDDDLHALVKLTRQVDRVELKFIVPSSAHRRAFEMFGISATRARRQRVYYLDTPDRLLHRRGVVVRVRSTSGRPDDSVVKLRPVVPANVAPRLRRSKQFIVEVDAMPGAYVCSAALRTRLGPDDVRRAMGRRGSLHDLFSKQQARLLAAHLPGAGHIDDLAVLGPIEASRHRFRPEGFDRVLQAERWTFPDGSRLLELSTRATPQAAARTAARLSAVLRRHGLDLTGPQRTKTRATLDFFNAAPAAQRAGRTGRRPTR
ncbi:CYTH domain-containing protein [Frankia torreyi]|uniref:CYTH domain-containing protein n=1 Tax=Frankia torreyi TaxID=1856 RepID=A0A0D8B8S4_9ACTN|nr:MULTISPECIES: CYTH domain-containing protein [Frankia]KJE19762.1 CYTH domain-containing protein [Frankia torreyi]KQC38339.1 adenylate cyclase [Frankia sp. ACN1ag]KQM02251.1 CYTH domain-containing protein [Frankia sp. CpI1-P]